MRIFLLLQALFLCFFCQAQLSDGEGELQKIQNESIEIYLPKHFIINSNPPGVMHEVSKTMIFVIKVPKEHHQSINSGKGQDFLIDPRMQNVRLEKQRGNRYGRSADSEVDYMTYELSGIQFERINSFVQDKSDMYLLMANYPLIVKDQVAEEVNKVLRSIKFLK